MIQVTATVMISATMRRGPGGRTDVSKATSEGSELPEDPRPLHERISPSAGEEGMGKQKGGDLRPPTRHEMGTSSWRMKEKRPLQLEGSWLGSPWQCGGPLEPLLERASPLLPPPCLC